MPAEPQTIGDLQERFKALDAEVRILGIGEGGLIALGFGDLTANIAMAEESPDELIAVFITLTVIAGALLARAWIEFHVASRKVQMPEGAQDDKAWRSRSIQEACDRRVWEAIKMYKRGRGILWSAITVLVAAGGCYVLSAWLWAIK